MFAREDVHSVFITLHIENEQVLFILLSSDGTVNRMGTGAEDNRENDLFIARTSPELFLALRSRIPPQTAQWEGSYSDPEPQGKKCRLSVGFMNSNGQESGITFQYGSKSQGPPPEICELVIAAVEISGPWYEEQTRIAAQGSS